MEIKEKMWVSYCGRPYFITIIEGDLYIMLDVENEITNIKRKDLHNVKPIEVPVFYVDEKVLYTGDYNKDIKISMSQSQESQTIDILVMSLMVNMT